MVRRLTQNVYAQDKERFEEENPPAEVHHDVMPVDALHSSPFLPVDLPRGHCCVEKQEEELTEKVPAQEEAIVGTS